MRDTKCETVRHELEELMLNDECSMSATRHLSECDDCREFHRKQTKLRRIVGSLGTVEAPADFDFRLRARLANDSSSAGFHLRNMQWSFATRGLAAAAFVLLFVGGVVYVSTITNQETRRNQVAEVKTEPPQPAPKPVEPEVVADVTKRPVLSDQTPRRVVVEGHRGPAKARPSFATLDSAVERPLVFSNSQLHSAIFPIDASQEPLRVSVDDGRGNARTISVPTITFGSQRVVPNSNQFVQKGTVW
ncbi:MAG TPA: hypothetical protein VFY51_11750 [Pyrinomonadaceae bacterium]|nr:hypothetical protein [Pyrinomonadaceae bacterium]